MEALRIGVIGISGHLMKRIMLPMAQSDLVELRAVASRNINKAQAAAEKWDVPKAYDSYEALLADEDIEAVYIPLPNHLHLEWVKKCADAGKHILCEKPLTMNAEETKEIMEYVADKGVLIMETFMYRFHPKWQMVREMMMVGDVGTVKSIHTIFTYANSDPTNIRNIKDFGGGALMDIGCYAISSARWILDKEPTRVMGLNTYSEAFGTDILSSGMMDFGDARALFTVSTDLYPAQEVTVYGTGGILKVKIPFNDQYDIGATIEVTDALGTRTVTFDPTNQYGEMFDAFAEAVRFGEVPLISLEDSWFNMRIIDQLIKSSETGNWEEI